MQNSLLTTTSATIAKIETPAEAAQLSKIAQAASEFYRAQDDREKSQQAKTIYIHAARRAGELLLPENTPREIGGDRKSTEYRSTVDPRTQYQEALDGAGITDSMSKVWQNLAKIPADVLEQYFTDPKYQHTEYTIKGLLSFAFGGSSNGLTLEGAMKKFQDVVIYIAVEFPDSIDDMKSLFEEILGE